MLETFSLCVHAWAKVGKSTIGGSGPRPCLIIDAEGSAQPVDYPVLTPSGWRRMGDITVGDHVIGSDGRATEVLGVYPQGPRATATVHFNDHTSVECDWDHLWTVLSDRGAQYVATARQIYKGETLNQPQAYGRGKQVRPWSAAIMRPDGVSRRLRIPMLSAPVEHEPVDLPIDPYTLGAWLGDGDARTGEMCGADPQVFSEIVAAGYRQRWVRPIKGTTCVVTAFDNLRQQLKEAGLLRDKRVPQEYLLGSPVQRLSLLQGLMDTDGCVATTTGYPRFGNGNERLIDAVVALTQSLGGVARKSKARETASGRSGWTVEVKLPAGLIPFRLERKVRLVRATSKYPPARRIDRIEPTGEVKDCVCIRVAAEDSLYVTKGYVLTHNTKFLPLRKIQWDPYRYAPPVPDGSWDAAVVTVRKIEDMIKVYEILMLGQHHFNTVVIDSVSEIQRKLKSSIQQAKTAEGWDMWEMVLTQMDYVLRGIRDLQDHPTRPVPVTIFISETMTNKAGKLIPNMQGKMGTILPYLFDVIGYMEMVPLTGPDGSVQIDTATSQVVQGRRIHIVQSPRWEAGERVQGRFGSYIDVPTIDMVSSPQPSTLVTDMYFHLFPHMRPQQGAMPT